MIIWSDTWVHERGEYWFFWKVFAQYFLSKAIVKTQVCRKQLFIEEKSSLFLPMQKKPFVCKTFCQSLEPKDVLTVCWPTIPSINFFKDLSTFFVSQEGDTCGLTLDYHFGLNIFFKWIFLTSRVTYFIW